MDWKTNEPQNMLKNIYDYFIFNFHTQKIYTYKLCPNPVGKQIGETKPLTKSK